ncbi:restin homolog [Toxorhynchites rutilus septentrionalis]|uniref:restin homolog n=1 Tax=Toxorhynchites rutilus septentrionalis TaxID=329112 RepID=UPI00247985C7|nr:restin homolog [Toxorhynchites rutilus septentrionalis]
MSYATQKEFFNVSYPNETPKLPTRKRSDGAIMTYDFCPDNRAWALDKEKRSLYILDVVHKTRFRKALLHPEGEFELTKDYLVHLDVEDLAEYILRLQTEIKRKKLSVRELEESHRQLETVRGQSNDYAFIQQQSAILEQERNEFEQQLLDLEEVIVNLKDRADRYDLLAKENELLRCQLQKQQMGPADKIRLHNAEAEAKFNRIQAEDYEKLEVELIIMKTTYEQLREQKRELKERLQKALLCQTKLTELKRQIAIEKDKRENIEEEMERLLVLYDKQSQELRRKTSYLTEANHRMESIQEDLRWSQDQMLQAIEENIVEENIYQDTTEPTENIRAVMDANTPRTDTTSSDEQLDLLKKQLEKCQTELEEHTEKEKSYQDRIQELEHGLVEHQTRLKEEEKKVEQQMFAMEFSRTRINELQNEMAAKQTDVDTRSGSVDIQIASLQKQLEDVRRELSGKSAELNTIQAENTLLQSKVSNYQDNIERLEEARKLDLEELEASKNELTKSRETMERQLVEHSSMLDGLEMGSLKEQNDTLRGEISKLEEKLSSAQKLLQDLQNKTSDHDALLKTIEDLKTELQSVNDSLEEKEMIVNRLGTEAEAIKVAAQMQDTLGPRVDDIPIDKQNLTVEIERLRTELGDCQKDLKQKVDAMNTDKQSLVEEMEHLRVKLGFYQEELEQKVDSIDIEKQHLIASAKQHSIDNEKQHLRENQEQHSIDEEKQQLIDEEKQHSIGNEKQQLREIEKQHSIDKEKQQLIDKEKQHSIDNEKQHLIDSEKQYLIEEIVSLRTQLAQCQNEIERYQKERDISEEAEEHEKSSIHDVIEKELCIEDEDDMGAGEYPEDYESSIEGAPDDLEEGDGDAKTQNISLVDEAERWSILQDNILTDEDILFIGSSDPDRTRAIALKIVRHGINALVIGELDHLHKELCRAVLDRYLMLSQNVATIDNGICTCRQIIKTVKTMRNSEMMGMFAFNTPVHVGNPVLLKDEVSVKLPPEAKPRSKSASSGIPDNAPLSSMFSKPARAAVQKANSRVLLGRFDPCRTREWRAPRTPQEMFFAGTLSDGSRLVTRQKRNI